MVEELIHSSSMWQKTYMSTLVITSATGAAEQGWQNIPIIDAPLVTMKSVMIPPLVV